MSAKIRYYLKDYTGILISLLIVTTFSGALRKWAGLPSIANHLFLLVIMAVPIYLLFVFKNKYTQALNKTITSLLQLFTFVLVILAIHPLNHSYFHGIFGFLIHFIFIAILLSYLKNKNHFNEKKIIKLFFFTLAFQLIIASIQYSSPADSVINRYADNRQDSAEDLQNNEEFVQASALVGDAVRVTGTFSYLGGYNAICFFFLLFTFYLSKTRSINYFLFLSPLIVYAALLSGSRGAVGQTLIFIVAFILTERKIFFKNPRPLLNGLVPFCLFLGINFVSGDRLGIIEKTSTAYDNFMLRVENNKAESEGRLTSDLVETFTRDFDYRYTGVGLGATYQGAFALFGSSSIVQNTPMEGELFRLLMEGGIFFVLFRWIFLIIIFSFLDIPLILKPLFFFFFCVFSQNVFHIYNATYFAIGLIILNQAYYKNRSSIESNSIPIR